MNIGQINENLEKVLENLHTDTFIFDLLLAYGTPKATISRAQQSTKRLFEGYSDVAIKKKIYFRHVTENIQAEFSFLRENELVKKEAPRFIVATDYRCFLAVDTKTAEILDCDIQDLIRHFDFFLPWAGMEKNKIVEEQEADVKAADRMAKLYDEICRENPAQTSEQVHSLNVFLSRLLFCYFAEDTDIFPKDLFTNSIVAHTQENGSDLNLYLDRLFEVMNTAYTNRADNLPAYLMAFPYVNGGLFREYHAAPRFTQRSRRMLIEAGGLKWQDINPDIFGSMIQAVVTPEHRGGLGMHYTSVPNIMKVIEPLFLDDLREEFTRAVEARHALSLQRLLKRIWNIKIFDPACGSGNFLIIAYKKLRELEMDIFNELDRIKGQEGAKKIDFEDQSYSEISLNNFYGIELDDFAHEVATLSLWLAEHQMNQEFKRQFGRTKPALPLKATGNIVHGNACRLDWKNVCPKNEGDEIYILGNPPYLGYVMQSSEQKDDMSYIFDKNIDFKKLDYISCWFYLGCKYIQNINSKFAFVSTNSITQGEQVALLWPIIFSYNLEICFAYTSFKWNNNAKLNAGVSVVIIGMRNISNKSKTIYFKNTIRNVSNINAYLANAKNLIVNKRQKPISDFPIMMKGSQPTDDGNLLLNREEKHKLITEYPELNKIIRPFYGAKEYIRGEERFCLWIRDIDLPFVNEYKDIVTRLSLVAESRKKSTKSSTVVLAEVPHKFGEIRYFEKPGIIVPTISSERREVIPIGFLDEYTIISNTAQAIYEYPVCLFSIISSSMQLTWVKAVGGKFKTDYIFSSSLCYNTFPFPKISDKQKEELEQHVYNILSEREKHSDKTLAQLYDPDKMPEGLREAHRLNDLAVERCYRSRPFESDEERLEYLFKLYEQMIEEEKERDTLIKGKKKSKK